MSGLFSVLTRCTIFDEALPFVRKLFTLFEKNVPQTFETLSRKVFIENVDYDSKSQTTLAFVRNRYLVEGDGPSPDHYDQEECCIMELDAWLQKLQRVFGTSEFVSDRNLR